MFPHKIKPKQHILEHHCIPHIQKHGHGLGLLWELETGNKSPNDSKLRNTQGLQTMLKNCITYSQHTYFKLHLAFRDKKTALLKCDTIYLLCEFIIKKKV